jgi:Transglutaminase-like superfamily
VDGWLDALARSYFVPAEFQAHETSRQEALNLLCCGDDVLDQLIEAGLPCSGEPGAELFDWHDLHNLGLYSGSGNSLPERCIRLAMRWMEKPPESWLGSARWDFRAALGCGRPHRGQPPPRWRIARPAPEVHGGEIVGALAASSPDAVIGEGYVEGTGEEFALAATIHTRGRSGVIRSRRLREILSEYAGADYRWVRLPQELQKQPSRVLSQGVSPCISVSLDLAAKCRGEGFAARTRIGWILGLLDLRHAWLEVVDEDGAWKTVDPVFAKLSAFADRPHPQFQSSCLGSTINRLLPTANEASDPLFAHFCSGNQVEPRKSVKIRKHDTQEPADWGI